MKKYRRIEVHAYRRRVTVVSGAWRPEDLFARTAGTTDDEVSLNDNETDEPVAPDSPEGQMILAEAVQSLQRRLSPEYRNMLQNNGMPSELNSTGQNVAFRCFQAFSQFIWPKPFRAKG